MNEKQIVVWGAGAIGGTIGAHLARAGREVVFVDLFQEHLKRIEAGQLRIEGPGIDFTAGGKAVTPDKLTGNFGLILLAVKIQDTPKATRALLPHLAADGCVISCQNGLASREVAEIVGRERTLAAAMFLPADLVAPGHITYSGRTSLYVGELDGRLTPRLHEVVGILQDFHAGVSASDDIFGNIWGKMALGIVLGASALTDETRVEFFSQPDRIPLIGGLVREVLGVAAADGYRAHDSDWFRTDAFLAKDEDAIRRSVARLVEVSRDSPKTHSGYWRDLVVHKRPTELPAQFMPMVAIAEKHGIPVPLTRLFLALIQDIEAGRRKTGIPCIRALMDAVA
jgi:2-dehydropantoate 2-reductase